MKKTRGLKRNRRKRQKRIYLGGLRDGGLLVHGLVLALGRHEGGEDVVAGAPAAGALPDDLEGRVVDGVIDIRPDLDGAARGDDKADGELEEQIRIRVHFATNAEPVEALILALLVLDQDEVAVGAALGDGHGAFGRPLVGLLAGDLAFGHHDLLAGAAGRGHSGGGGGLHVHATTAAAAAAHGHGHTATTT